MMRSLFSGVAGLKTHQTKMDVIGNNIANVNTTAYKSQSVTFSDLMYQTTQKASGSNAQTGLGGTNARQIGLGVKSGAITTAIDGQGASQTTNNPWDVMITGDSFFVVSNGQENFFTRDGSFYVDGAGNLAMRSNGYNVMGWQVNDDGSIKKDTVSALRIMNDTNMTYPPEATSQARVTGNLDKLDPNVNSSAGRIMNLEFFDSLGYKYTAKMSIHSTGADGKYYVQLDDVLDSNGKSIGADMLADVTFGQETLTVSAADAKTLVDGKCLPGRVVIKTNTGAELTFPQDGAATAVDTAINISGTDAAATANKAALSAIYGIDFTATPYDTVQSVKVGPDGQLSLFSDTAGTVQVGGVMAIQNGKLTGSDFVLKSNGTPAVTYPAAGFIAPGNEINIPAAGADRTALETLYGINFDNLGATKIKFDENGVMTITQKTVKNAANLEYNTENGSFVSVNGSGEGMLTLGLSGAAGKFSDININFANSTNVNTDKSSTIGATAGTPATADSNGNLGAGRKVGEMSDLIIQDDGKIYASYDNGQSRLLGQIAVANFANASGLEKAGDNLYSATLNSGAFDGIGADVKANGGYFASGVLEMSNVDLSSEFTEMITTQRGFQANSRIITVSDTMLEELTNLKR